MFWLVMESRIEGCCCSCCFFLVINARNEGISLVFHSSPIQQLERSGHGWKESVEL